jgi:hypothetical protein
MSEEECGTSKPSDFIVIHFQALRVRHARRSAVRAAFAVKMG